jgi:hypothetical protein
MMLVGMTTNGCLEGLPVLFLFDLFMLIDMSQEILSVENDRVDAFCWRV